ARECYLAFDLELPNGDPSALSLQFGAGPRASGRALHPTMPAFGLATLRGGRDPRTFRQWWALPWRPEPGDSRGMVTVHGPATARIFGTLGAPAGAGEEEALSLGEWPALSVYRLMHDDEYRLPVRRRLEGARRSAAAGGPLGAPLNVRLVVVRDAEETVAWE